MKSFVWLAVLLLTIPLVSPAVDRYVAPNGFGSACTQATPCTLNTGLQQAVGGDTVYLLNGTYRQVVQTVRNGSVNNRIRIQALNRHQARIEWPFGNVFDQLFDLKHDYITLQWVRLDGTGPNGSSWDLLRINGVSSANPAENVIVEDVWAHDGGHALLLIADARNVTVRRSIFDNSGLTNENGEAIYISSANSFRPVIGANIHSNTFSRFTSNAVDYKGQARNIDVHHNIFEDQKINAFSNFAGDGNIRSVSNEQDTVNTSSGNFFRDNIYRDSVGNYTIRLQGNRVDVLNNVFYNMSGSPFVDSRTMPQARIQGNVACSWRGTLNLGAACDAPNCSNNRLNRPQSECDAEVDRILAEQ